MLFLYFFALFDSRKFKHVTNILCPQNFRKTSYNQTARKRIVLFFLTLIDLHSPQWVRLIQNLKLHNALMHCISVNYSPFTRNTIETWYTNQTWPFVREGTFEVQCWSYSLFQLTFIPDEQKQCTYFYLDCIWFKTEIIFPNLRIMDKDVCL